MSSSPPRARLGRILDDLGSTLVELVCGDADGSHRDIGGVVIYDPHDELELPQHALVLGVGVHDRAQIAGLLSQLGEHGASALLVRAPVRAEPVIKEASRRSGVALLGVAPGASWDQLAAMIRSLINDGDRGAAGKETLGGLPSGDLFALANAVSALVGAPVTIEDRGCRVLAFSGGQEETDPPRIATILGRQVPAHLARNLEENGVFQAIYRSRQPVYIDSLPVDESELSLPRAVMVVRAGDEVLGSIWAAVQSPLSEEQCEALCDAAKLVALHMMWLRTGSDVERRLRAGLVGTALEGGAAAAEAARRLGLAVRPSAVLAFALAAVPADEAQYIAERQQVLDALALHLGAVHPCAATALVGDVVYAVLPVPGDDDAAEDRALRIAADFCGRLGERLRVLAGVGPIALDGTALFRSRAGADRALRALREGRSGRTVARTSDVLSEILLLEMAALITEHGDTPAGPIARLRAYDAEHNTYLVTTLDAWLDAFGDIPAAASAIFVHPNTFRYRLRRLAEISGMDVGDPEARFAAMLQLRLWRRLRTAPA
ncbi:PucR family transcriptional regulator [Amycolatopsis sp. cg5]|uniref:PucR family transcriptional regulator n=1 Tax=Amycolatopsis sp. cg5 TaxID=3238802 RepID=UPI003526A149